MTQSDERKGAGETCYNSQEFETPPNKELKKIQVVLAKKFHIKDGSKDLKLTLLTLKKL